MNTTIDARGMPCPKPLILTKKAFSGLPVNGELTVLMDNETAFSNVKRFLTDHGAQLACKTTDGVYELSVVRLSAAAPSAENKTDSQHVISIGSDCMGQGDRELGLLLMKGFVSTLKEIEPKPKTIVFYNAGIFLTLKDTPAVPALRELESQGVDILVCGTCADYYRKKADIAVGKISNMYDILSVLTQAGHVINP
ncbi:MAG: sulfurtransferase-like selenium metabolism protein YedF [Pontiellaceae bacterium]|jgi:selenium metabolism protein YedF|nr:sulfurtransferase-like selenium metabolism protein YedF [Pontiellaceae bacterium]